MNLRSVLTIFVVLLTLPLINCGGGGGSDGGSNSGNNGNPVEPAEPADRFVVSGNADGTLSLLRVNRVAGYATTIAFTKVSGFSIEDMVFDTNNNRLVAIDRNNLYIFGVDIDSGEFSLLDSESGSNFSHLVLSSNGTKVYIASGDGGGNIIDSFSIDNDGLLTALDDVTVSDDPDYIQLNPSESQIYVTSQGGNLVQIFNLSDGVIDGSSSSTFNTNDSPRAMAFHPTLDIAYLVRSDNSDDSLEVLNVDPSTGELSATGDQFDVDSNAIDIVIDTAGEHLYVLESSNETVFHYQIDSADGSLTFVASHNISFTPTDLQLSHTGEQLYISHSEDENISTLAVNSSDGTLEVMNFTRVFDNAQSIASIGGNGALTPTASFLLAPDTSGLNRFSIASDGSLSLDNKESASGALITGEVGVDYLNGLLFAAGENDSDDDVIANYTFDLNNGNTTAIDDFIGSFDEDSDFQRIQVGKSGEYFYVQDQGSFSSTPAFDVPATIKAYSYDANGDVTATPIDNETRNSGPENMTLSPNGRYLYSITSFDDIINWFEINSSDGTLFYKNSSTPGGTGLGAGRPIDLAFHPNGRYAYVSIQDDSEIGRYEVDNDNGSLDNINRFNTATSNGGDETNPAPLAMHPSGLFLFAGERTDPQSILVMNILPNSSYGLSFQQRLEIDANPTWIAVTPNGETVYVRDSNEDIEVFEFDASSGTLTSTGQKVSAGSDGGFLGTLTIVAPYISD